MEWWRSRELQSDTDPLFLNRQVHAGPVEEDSRAVDRWALRALWYNQIQPPVATPAYDIDHNACCFETGLWDLDPYLRA